MLSRSKQVVGMPKPHHTNSERVTEKNNGELEEFYDI